VFEHQYSFEGVYECCSAPAHKFNSATATTHRGCVTCDHVVDSSSSSSSSSSGTAVAETVALLQLQRKAIAYTQWREAVLEEARRACGTTATTAANTANSTDAQQRKSTPNSQNSASQDSGSGTGSAAAAALRSRDHSSSSSSGKREGAKSARSSKQSRRPRERLAAAAAACLSDGDRSEASSTDGTTTAATADAHSTKHRSSTSSSAAAHTQLPCGAAVMTAAVRALLPNAHPLQHTVPSASQCGVDEVTRQLQVVAISDASDASSGAKWAADAARERDADRMAALCLQLLAKRSGVSASAAGATAAAAGAVQSDAAQRAPMRRHSEGMYMRK
jgi:hypothetical protein